MTGTELTHVHFPELGLGRSCPWRNGSRRFGSWTATIADPAERARLHERARRTRIARTAEIDLVAFELERRCGELEERCAQLDEQLAEHGARLAERETQLAEHDARIARLRAAQAAVESSRTWRLRNRLLALRPVRALAARLPAAR